MVVRNAIWQDPRMRQFWVWAVSIAAVALLSACGGKPVVAASSEDVLVLEVGGDQASLRAALVALGRTVGEGHRLNPQPAVAVGADQPDPNHLYQGQPLPDPDVRPEPLPRPAPQPEDKPIVPDDPAVSPWVLVPLQKDETLIHIARRCLGDGRRFLEVMEWNGWSDQDTRHLRTGIDVKIKRSEMRAPK